MTLSIRQNNFTIVPQNLTEAMTFADLIAKSSFCPDAMKEKGGDVLIAMQMGAEIGLSPMQALQNIAVIRGRPTLWGDAALAVIMAHPCYVSHREWHEGSIKDGTRIAYCGITRKNSEEEIKSFSMDDAKLAGLWGKSGVWSQYPDRMLQMRARSFAIRDKFADALRGISCREEVEDYNIQSNKNGKVINMPGSNKQIESKPEQIIERDITKDLDDISWCNTLYELQVVYSVSYKHWISLKHKDNVKLLIDAKDKRKLEIMSEQKETVIDQETGEVVSDE
jgi:hypothetical protein